MLKLAERGVAHIVLLLVVLAGIAGGVFILKSPENFYQLFRPKAGPGVNVMFLDSQGNEITATSSANVKVKLTEPSWDNTTNSPMPIQTTIPVPTSSPVTTYQPIPTSRPTEIPVPRSKRSWLISEVFAQNKSGGGPAPKPTPRPTPTVDLVTIQGTFVGTKGAKITNNCIGAQVSYSGNKFTFKVSKGMTFCIRSSDVPGYKTVAFRSPLKDKPISYESQVAGINCANKKVNCSEASKKLDIHPDNNYIFRYERIKGTPVPSLTPTSVPTTIPVPVTTIKAILSEDPNFTVNVKNVDFTTGPVISAPAAGGGTQAKSITTDYTFSSSTAGTKTLYVKFIASNGKEQKANPYPATIQLIPQTISVPVTPSPFPIPSPSPSATPSPSPFQISVNPTSVNTSGDVTIKWSNFTNPATNDYIWWVDSKGVKTGLTMYPSNSCKDSSGGTPISTGSCTVKAPVYAGIYQAILYRSIPSGTEPRTEVGRSNSFTVTAISSPTPTPQATSKRVFVTSTTYNGNLGGLSGADQKCQARANAASLGGNWKAWLSDKNISASSRLNHASLPYKLLNGKIIADNWTDLTDGVLKDYANIQVYENGQVRAQGDGTYYVWTGTDSSGNSMSNNCVNWTTSQGFDGTYGSLAVINVAWTEAWGSSSSCGMQYRLYCFEQ